MDSEVGVERGDDDGNPPTGTSPIELLGFVLRAAHRHVRLGILVAAIVAAIGLLVAQFVPVTFDATSRIFVDESVSKTEELSSPDRALPNLDPISGTFVLLMQKSNLVSMVNETGLLANWEANRPAPLRVKDQVVSWIGGGSPTLKEKSEALARMLEPRMFLKRDKNIISIRVLWTDPDGAFQLTKLTQNRLIELLRMRETASYSSAITILEDETKHAGEAIEQALAEVVRVRKQVAKSAAGVAAPIQIGTSSRRPGIDAGTLSPAPTTGDSSAQSAQQLSSRLAELSGKIRVIEEPWHRRQEELNSRLTELKAVYGQMHPQVVQQEAQIKAAKVPHAELADLRKARSDLLNQIQVASAEVPPKGTTAPRAVTRAESLIRSGSANSPGSRDRRSEGDAEDEDPTVTASKAELTRAIEGYSRLTTRLASARLQFTTAQSAFNTRFVVTGEPEFPRKPLRPLRTILSLSAIAAGVIFGLLAGAIRDLASGKIHEPWQVRSFRLKTLGEVPVLSR